uniref:Uncharacterized protein n=1 Tax=Heterorhabditis bacteriophora TaxID=37862 RepID=A0A1I7XB48_HETBA
MASCPCSSGIHSIVPNPITATTAVSTAYSEDRLSVSNSTVTSQQQSVGCDGRLIIQYKACQTDSLIMANVDTQTNSGQNCGVQVEYEEVINAGTQTERVYKDTGGNLPYTPPSDQKSSDRNLSFNRRIKNEKAEEAARLRKRFLVSNSEESTAGTSADAGEVHNSNEQPSPHAKRRKTGCDCLKDSEGKGSERNMQRDSKESLADKSTTTKNFPTKSLQPRKELPITQNTPSKRAQSTLECTSVKKQSNMQNEADDHFRQEE